MKILVINSGSSSLKYQLLDMKTEQVMATGLLERIGESVGRARQTTWPGTDQERELRMDLAIADHRAAMLKAVDLLTAEDCPVVHISEIGAIGHRVVQGGETLLESTHIDDTVIEKIRANCPLSPLHNPANLIGIEVARELFAQSPQVAVFDTQFHQTMPPEAFLYPLPYALYEELKIRRYGFHGTSHGYVARQVAAFLGQDQDTVNLITLHLGNGCSATAIRGGKCVDTSMGLTPLAGLMMGTRCGDIDPAILPFLAQEKELSMPEIGSLLNKDSGLKGICGQSDMRDIHAAAQAGDERAALARRMFVYRIKKYIGAYLAIIGPVHGLVFTAGIGENDAWTRLQVCAGLEHLGLCLDRIKNAAPGQGIRSLHASAGRVPILVVPTNEELAIAQATLAVLDQRSAVQ